MKPSKIILPAFLALAFSSNAKIELPNIFTDNMVIQADTMAAIWGKPLPAPPSRQKGRGENPHQQRPVRMANGDLH